jgi:hypothetical protein
MPEGRRGKELGHQTGNCFGLSAKSGSFIGPSLFGDYFFVPKYETAGNMAFHTL